MMKGGPAIKESGPSCWPSVNLDLMNNINSLTVFGSTPDCREGWGGVGWGGCDDPTLIFLSHNFREQVNSILVVNNGS